MRVGGNGGEIFVADLKVQIISFDAKRGDARSRSRDRVRLFRGASERSRKRDRTDLGRDLSAHFTLRKVRRVNVHISKGVEDVGQLLWREAHGSAETPQGGERTIVKSDEIPHHARRIGRIGRPVNVGTIGGGKKAA